MALILLTSLTIVVRGDGGMVLGGRRTYGARHSSQLGSEEVL